jgi:hypothetical protein
MSRLSHLLENRRTDGGKVVSLTRLPAALYLQEYYRYSRHGCLCVFCVRFFCFHIVSSETASRPNKRLVRTYHWISLFNVIYKVSKLAYRTGVILIANKKNHKKFFLTEVESTPGR